MFEINKERFGGFIASLRKEKGWTQKEVAQRLYVSDKAVSKWETGASIPDTALLVPMAELFGVTVTELLMCGRVEPSASMDAQQVERVVKTAIAYPDESPVRAWQVKSPWPRVYVLALALLCAELAWSMAQGYMTMGLILTAVLSTAFGAYFCLFALMRLPDYYDENRVYGYHDLFFDMNFTGLRFHNGNWPHILTAARVWAVAVMAGYPIWNLLLCRLLPGQWLAELFSVLLAVLGGFFLPVYIVGKRHEQQE